MSEANPAQSEREFETHLARKARLARAGIEWDFDVELKCWRPYFDDIDSGRKPFDVRPDDRPFEVGQWIRLREWDQDAGAYTGRERFIEIVYVLRGEQAEQFGLKPGYCVLGLG